MRIRLHTTAAPIYTLGPYARFGVWVQGCTRSCPGCVTPDSQPLTGGIEEEVEVLARRILQNPGLEGLTISGGEPFLQEDALCELIRIVRQSAPLGVILYTGYLFEEISSRPLTALCDAIIDGLYVDELNDGGSMRGSSNQRLILLTSRYEGLIPFGTLPRKTELVASCDGGLAQVGVPSRKAVEQAHIIQKELMKGKKI